MPSTGVSLGAVWGLKRGELAHKITAFVERGMGVEGGCVVRAGGRESGSLNVEGRCERAGAYQREDED